LGFFCYTFIRLWLARRAANEGPEYTTTSGSTVKMFEYGDQRFVTLENTSQSHRFNMPNPWIEEQVRMGWLVPITQSFTSDSEAGSQREGIPAHLVYPSSCYPIPASTYLPSSPGNTMMIGHPPGASVSVCPIPQTLVLRGQYARNESPSTASATPTSNRGGHNHASPS
jgi:hypothetical protein